MCHILYENNLLRLGKMKVLRDTNWKKLIPGMQGANRILDSRSHNSCLNREEVPTAVVTRIHLITWHLYCQPLNASCRIAAEAEPVSAMGVMSSFAISMSCHRIGSSQPLSTALLALILALRTQKHALNAATSVHLCT